MDDRLEKALEFANYQRTLHLEKKRIQSKLRQELELVFNGGRFLVDRNFIVFLHLFNPDEDGSITILDENLTPIIISNLEEFQKEANNTYHRAVNRYRVDFEELKKKRTVKAIVNL
jgi:hypothetical protein